MSRIICFITYVKIKMWDKFSIRQDQEWGQEPDDGEDHLHVDLGPVVGAGVLTVARPGDDHPPPLQTNGE